ncbi:MAG: hypothetical protein KF775_02875 [Cyclobacteriaceae bacterium]|nr:hypothetical protein [Cyclobacteriaceae bacterium]
MTNLITFEIVIRYQMKSTDLKFSLVESYLGLLNSLSPERKLELISRLSDSIKGSKKPSNKSIEELYGAFVSNQSADEIIADIRSSRRFDRKIEDLE